MKSDEIRESFLEYFREREHRVIKSSSLIPNDPTLLLSGAGMVQFKPYFLGSVKPEFKRVTTCQKCMRTTDIEKVGLTARHLTFFEMLGNFSFGDYYKPEAIQWAWEFLTVNMALAVERLYCSVYDNDDEAYYIWRDDIRVPEERLVRLGEEDNFWDMGMTGPCGPCSEILYDKGEDFGCGRPQCRPGCDCDRYLELWNLVFMQYDRDEKGVLHPLPSRNIDTGLGLERLASVLQGATNNFETDSLLPIVRAVAEEAGTRYGSSGKTDISMKIIADHARAIAFMVGDGVMPSNEDRGYILRRLIRRAVRYGRMLGIEDIFLPRVVDVVVEIMGGAYHDLRQNHTYISSIVRSEEERFFQTLRTGMLYFDETVARLKSGGGDVINGEAVFHLHDTLGFPLELTRELALEQNLRLDEQRFERLMEEQKERARTARVEEGYSHQVQEVYTEILDNYGETHFTGYETLVERARIVAIVIDRRASAQAVEGEEVEIFLDRTPFYGEMGGQVGDKGDIISPGGEAQVLEAFRPVHNLISHKARVKRGVVKTGDAVEAEVEEERRMAIRRNHTATHILHWALREVLGDHAKQTGSLVDQRRLRFDFTNFAPLSTEELDRVEELSNDRIMEDLPVRSYVTTLDYARSINAVALFGEKYEEYVRVVEVDEISRELCGGTHVGRTGEIGQLAITAESGIGANMRRIEAFTGMEAYLYHRDRGKMLKDLAGTLKVEESRLPERLQRTLKRIKDLEAELEKHKSEEVSFLADKGIEWEESEIGDGEKVLTAAVEDFKAQDLRNLAERTLARYKAGVVGVVNRRAGKADIVVAVSKQLVGAGLDAVEVMEKASGLLGGGGGGRPDMAMGGGSDTSQIKEALAVIVKDANTALVERDAHP
ncbi:MAG: alanine--tRNA ligase [Actinomycetota bacterium]|nr:alanine--tRNA ligase [Actinomycetota bacterium]